MSGWSTNPVVHQACVERLRELVKIEDPARRWRAALGWVEYFGAYPEQAGDRPTTYLSVLAQHALDPSLLKL